MVVSWPPWKYRVCNTEYSVSPLCMFSTIHILSSAPSWIFLIEKQQMGCRYMLELVITLNLNNCSWIPSISSWFQISCQPRLWAHQRLYVHVNCWELMKSGRSSDSSLIPCMKSARSWTIATTLWPLSCLIGCLHERMHCHALLGRQF